MKFISQMKRPGATVAGVFSLALGSVVLLCGAGPVPVENFTPQGPMQADLNAGGHNLTNIATISAANLTLSGTLTAANLGSAATNAASAFAPASGPFPWAEVSGVPTMQVPISLTTSGTSGAATFASGTLNIPRYAGTSYVVASPLALSSGTVSLPYNSTLTVSGGSLSLNLASANTWAAAQTGTWIGTHTGTFTGQGSGTWTGLVTGTSTFANGAPLSGVTGLGAGVVGALGSGANAASGALVFNSVQQLPLPLVTTVSPNSAVIFIGESRVHYPEVGAGSNGQQSATGGIGGNAMAQWLSTYPAFANIPIYDFSVGGSTCVGASRILAHTTSGSGYPNDYFYNGTEYENGAVVGSVAGLSSTVASIAAAVSSAGGTVYFVNSHDGGNESGQSISASTYITDMLANFATERAMAAKTKIVAFCGPQAALYSLAVLAPYADQMRLNLRTNGGPDALVDLSQTFVNPYDTNFYYTDNTHFSTGGDNLAALMTQGEILGASYTPSVSNLSIYSPAIGGTITQIGSGNNVNVFGIENTNVNGYSAINAYANTGTQELGFGYANLSVASLGGSDFFASPQGAPFEWFLGTNTYPTFKVTSTSVSTGTATVPFYIYDGGTNNQIGMFPAPGFGDEIFTTSSGSISLGQMASGSFTAWLTQNSGTLTEAGAISAGGPFKTAATQTAVAGTSSGTATFSEPFQGASYKLVIIELGATLGGTASYTFPVAFSNTPAVMNSDPGVTSLSTSVVTVTGTLTLPRTVVLEGY